MMKKIILLATTFLSLVGSIDGSRTAIRGVASTNAVVEDNVFQEQQHRIATEVSNLDTTQKEVYDNLVLEIQDARTHVKDLVQDFTSRLQDFSSDLEKEEWNDYVAVGWDLVHEIAKVYLKIGICLIVNSNACRNKLDEAKEEKDKIVSGWESEMFVRISERYRKFGIELIAFLTKALAVRVELTGLKEKITIIMNTPGFEGVAAVFQDPLSDVEDELQKCLNISSNISDELRVVNEVVFGNVCVEILGMESIIPSEKIPDFSVAVKDAMQMAFLEDGFDVMMKNVVVLEQATFAQNGKPKRHRELLNKRELGVFLTLRVKLLASWQCNCEDDGPINDLFARRALEESSSLFRRSLWSEDVLQHFSDTVKVLLETDFPTVTGARPISCSSYADKLSDLDFASHNAYSRYSRHHKLP